DVLLSPLTTQEAVLSSRMEGTQATLGDVLKFEAGAEVGEESKRQDIQEIINYRQALQTAEGGLKKRPFNLNLLLQLHGILLDSVRGRNKARGLFRTEQNWIGTRFDDRGGSVCSARAPLPKRPSRQLGKILPRGGA